MSAQMVLIGPPSEREAIGGQGPQTTGTAVTQPLPTETVKQLNAALGTSELVDPALPTPPALSSELAAPQQRLAADPWGAIVNLAVLNVPVLKNISFDIHAKRTVAVVGESGSGKSTLARATRKERARCRHAHNAESAGQG